MRNSGLKSLSLLFVSLLLGVSSGTPQRHLTYAFAVYPTWHQTGPVSRFSGPGTGTMEVTILGKAPDGGMLVEARDWWWNAVRPRQIAQCEIYDNYEIACAEFPILSDAQQTLMPLLITTFYPDASTSRWQREYSYSCVVRLQPSQCKADLTYSAAKGANGTVEIAAQGTYHTVGLRSQTIRAQSSITYDPMATLPVFVHDTKSGFANATKCGTSVSVVDSRSVDLKLLHD